MMLTCTQRMCLDYCLKSTAEFTLGKMSITTAKDIREGECQKWDLNVGTNAISILLMGVFIHVMNMFYS